MKLFSGVLFLVVAGSGALGCDALSGKVQEKAMAMAKDATEKAAKAAEGVAAQGAQAALSEGEQLAQKLDYTIKCTNGSKERAYGSWNYYTSGVNPETGMPIRKGSGGRVHTMGHVLAACDEAVEKGPTLKPDLPEIDAAQKEYTSALHDMSKIADELEAYYKNEDFKDDAWAVGMKNAPLFKAAFERFDKAAIALGHLVDAKKHEADVQMLVVIEKRSGKKLEWHTKNSLMAAKEVINCLSANPDTPPEKEACDPAFTAFEEAKTEFQTYHDAQVEEAKGIMMMSSFESSLADFYAEAKKTLRSVRAGTASPKEVGATIDEYNDLVGAANRLRFQ